jgi:hypothetical protein
VRPRPELARTIASMNIDLSAVVIKGTLMSGIDESAMGPGPTSGDEPCRGEGGPPWVLTKNLAQLLAPG